MASLLLGRDSRAAAQRPATFAEAAGGRSESFEPTFAASFRNKTTTSRFYLRVIQELPEPIQMDPPFKSEHPLKGFEASEYDREGAIHAADRPRKAPLDEQRRIKIEPGLEEVHKMHKLEHQYAPGSGKRDSRASRDISQSEHIKVERTKFEVKPEAADVARQDTTPATDEHEICLNCAQDIQNGSNVAHEDCDFTRKKAQGQDCCTRCELKRQRGNPRLACTRAGKTGQDIRRGVQQPQPKSRPQRSSTHQRQGPKRGHQRPVPAVGFPGPGAVPIVGMWPPMVQAPMYGIFYGPNGPAIHQHAQQAQAALEAAHREIGRLRNEVQRVQQEAELAKAKLEFETANGRRETAILRTRLAAAESLLGESRVRSKYDARLERKRPMVQDEDGEVEDVQTNASPEREHQDSRESKRPRW
ncbi:hypothetical protein LTR56_003909 [Elasticomyces elasticus]|nr:hypothetical protein LTR56_003909 [Elasticomyces elasticus]KAK3661105.1 hypothetical protein LTR22_007731 [Elasticomyces elasticus]KAK4921111.1 hypothetical protein LTR49_011481 [Elasticomyces elasticus]KAK5748544.1 hypothetical protein LTS12_021388 [Elasticomyces elasticus]